MFGLQPSGFIPKRLADIRAELETAYRDAFGAGIQVHEKSVFGRIIGITSAALSDCWEAAATLYNAFNPNAATGAALDNLAQVRGLTGRLPATRSTAILVAAGDPFVVIPAKTQFKQKTTGATFESLEVVTLDAAGSGAFEVRAIEYGDITAPGNPDPALATLTEIAMPIFGLDSVFNPADAKVGQAEETDAALRLRMKTDLLSLGTGAVDAIRARIRELPAVFDVSVVENASPNTDANGRPPHSFEVIVEGGDPDEIAGLVWAMKPAGIVSVNSTAVINAGDAIAVQVVDAIGGLQTVRIGRPGKVEFYMTIKTTPAAGLNPAAIDTLKNALVAEVQTVQRIGADVIHYRYSCLAIQLLNDAGVSGLTGIEVFIGKFSNPASTSNIAIGETELAVLDAVRIEVLP